jgi:hypothetical protein
VNDDPTAAVVAPFKVPMLQCFFFVADALEK